MDNIIGTVRASSWPELFDCSYRWYWKNIVGLRHPSSAFSALGTAIHAGTAVFDHARLEGHEGDAELAADVAYSHISEAEDVDWEDSNPRELASVAVRLTAMYCQIIAPTRKYLAVEIQCNGLDIVTKHGAIRVTGTTDRIRQDDDGRIGVDDLKSGARAVEMDDNGEYRAVTKGHHLQLGIYALMGEQESGLVMDAPSAIIGLQTATKSPRVAVGEIADVKTPLLGDAGTPGLIEIAAGMLKSGVFPPNPKSTLCSKRYCPAYARCKFHD